MTWAVNFRVQGAGEAEGKRVRRLAGAKRRLTIGEYPSMGLAEARAKALEVKKLAREGRDPALEQGPSKRAAPIVSDLIDRYVREHLGRNLRSGANVEKLLRRHVEPRWGHRDLRSLTRSDLIGLLEQVRIPREVEFRTAAGQARKELRGGPGAASELRKWVQGMFRFAAENEMTAANPFQEVRNRDKQRKRDRVLTMDEMALIWKATAGVPYPWGPFLQLIMLTGDRRSEWANAKSDWLNSEMTRLEIPSSDYKSEKRQVVPLSRQAQAVVQGLPRQEFGPFLFSSTGGVRPVSGFSKIKQRIDTLISHNAGRPLAHWTFHDLRRSMATHMERIGIQPHVIEVCLGHALKGVSGVYRQYEYLPEKTEALQRWADELLGTLEPGRPTRA